MPPCEGGVLLCSRAGFNPIDVLVEDALVGGPPDTGYDTVEAFTDFIDRLLTQVDTSPSGAPNRQDTPGPTPEQRAHPLALAPGLTPCPPCGPLHLPAFRHGTRGGGGSGR